VRSTVSPAPFSSAGKEICTTCTAAPVATSTSLPRLSQLEPTPTEGVLSWTRPMISIRARSLPNMSQTGMLRPHQVYGGPEVEEMSAVAQPHLLRSFTSHTLPLYLWVVCLTGARYLLNFPSIRTLSTPCVVERKFNVWEPTIHPLCSFPTGAGLNLLGISWSVRVDAFATHLRCYCECAASSVNQK